MKTIFKDLTMPDNVLGISKDTEDTEPLIFIPKDKSYIQILDYKIEGFDDFESFKKYLIHIRDVEKEITKLNNIIQQLQDDKKDFVEYLKIKLEESKLESTYGGQGQFISIQERIYREILNKVEEK